MNLFVLQKSGFSFLTIFQNFDSFFNFATSFRLFVQVFKAFSH